MKTTTHETLTKIMNLRDESLHLIGLYERATRLANPSAKIREMMDIAACKIKQNIREEQALRATLPIQ